jgi:hypothetical protein
MVSWHCKRTWQPDSCTISLSRQGDGKVFFTHQTNDRYIQAVWRSDSSRCVLLDAPDNANSHLWLFRIRGRGIATEKRDYEKISYNNVPVIAVLDIAKPHSPKIHVLSTMTPNQAMQPTAGRRTERLRMNYEGP